MNTLVDNVYTTLQDFEKNGVFDAQWTLEDRHREEEMRLQRFLSEEREKEMKRLDGNLGTEKERAAAELLAGMDQMSIQQNSRNLVAERERIEEHFRRLRDERMRSIMDKVASEEKARTARMVDRQCQEILLLIAEKVDDFKNVQSYYQVATRLICTSCSCWNAVGWCKTPCKT